MAFLRTTFAILALISPIVLADSIAEDDIPEDRRSAIAEFEQSQCASTVEYIRTLKFIRENRILMVTEDAGRKIADQVSKGCNGAADRFSKTLILLKTIGVSDRKALETAFTFSKLPDQMQYNFAEIFSKTFLAEFFDHDYSTALKLALELSKDYKGDPAMVREDFIDLVKFCKDTQSLDLPIKLCYEYTIKLARLSQYYLSGVRQHFYKLYSSLRNREDLSLDVKSSLDISYNVLKHGPKAADNFFAAFEYAVSKDGLNHSIGKATEFALTMAKRSHVGPEPLIIPGFFSTTRSLASEAQR